MCHAINQRSRNEPRSIIISSTMISYRILCCLFLITLSQYGDTRKVHSVESILHILHRIEDLITNNLAGKQGQHTLNCLIPIEKLLNLISDFSKISNPQVVPSEPKIVPTEPEVVLTELEVVPSEGSSNENSSEVANRRSMMMTRMNRENFRLLRKALGFDDMETDMEPMMMRDVEKMIMRQKRHHNHHINENINSNINTNTNANQFRARRTIGTVLPFKAYNRNINANYNLNTNAYKPHKRAAELANLSDEE